MGDHELLGEPRLHAAVLGWPALTRISAALDRVLVVWGILQHAVVASRFISPRPLWRSVNERHHEQSDRAVAHGGTYAWPMMSTKPSGTSTSPRASSRALRAMGRQIRGAIPGFATRRRAQVSSFTTKDETTVISVGTWPTRSTGRR